MLLPHCASVYEEAELLYSNNKDLAKVVKQCVRVGWSFRRRKRHGKLVAPNGKWVIVPCTPSDRRALKNFLGDLRRCYG